MWESRFASSVQKIEQDTVSAVVSVDTERTMPRSSFRTVRYLSSTTTTCLPAVC